MNKKNARKICLLSNKGGNSLAQRNKAKTKISLGKLVTCFAFTPRFAICLFPHRLVRFFMRSFSLSACVIMIFARTPFFGHAGDVLSDIMVIFAQTG